MINFRRVIFFKKNSPKRNILWFLVNSIYYDMKFFYLIFFNNQNQNNQKMNKYVNVMIQIKRSIDRTLFFPKCQQSVDNYNQIIWKIHKKKVLFAVWRFDGKIFMSREFHRKSSRQLPLWSSSFKDHPHAILNHSL